MKKILQRLVLTALVLSMGVSCTTAYDRYGRPRQVVEPGAALLGAAAVGLLAYGLASDNRGYRRHHSDYHGGYGYRERNCYY
jgi:hypothetical protein